MNWNFLQLRSLKTRITLFTLTIFVFGIWSLAYYASRMLREDMQRVLGEQQFATVSFAAASVSEELTRQIGGLEAVAGIITPALMNNTGALQAMIEDRAILPSLFNAGITVLRRDGTAIVDVPRSTGRIGRNFINIDYVAQTLAEGKSSIGEPILGPVLKRPVLGMAAPIRDAQGNVVGALSGVTDLTKPNFLDNIEKIGKGHASEYSLSDARHRKIVTGTDKSRSLTPFPKRGVNPLLDRYADGFEGFGTTVDSRGVEILSAAKQIPIAGWFIVARTPAAKAFSPIGAMQQNILLATIVLTLLAGALTWLMLRRQLAPMVTAAKALALAEPAMQPLAVARQDEIGDLISGFNSLLETLRNREKSLMASEERFRSIVQNSEDAIFIRDANGVAIYVSPQCERVTGYPPEVFLGKERVDIVHPEDRERRDAAWEALARKGERFSGQEFRVRLSDGGYRWLSGTAGRITFPDGTLGLQSNVRDITRRKQSEKALLESEARNRKLIDVSPDGIWIHSQGIIHYANDALVRMLGYSSAQELLGHSIHEFFPPGEQASLSRRIDSTAKQALPVNVFATRLHRDGSLIPVDVTAASYVQDGKPWNIAIARDITERKRAEAERAVLEARLRESQKMEALGTLAGGIAHDFNNIIATILGNTDLARQDTGVNPKVQESLDEIRKAGTRARELVRQILAFSRRQPTERKPILLAPVVEEAARLLRSTLPARVSLNVRCETGVPAVLADAIQIQQVLINLATNAIQAMRGSPGAIDIRLDAYRVNAVPYAGSERHGIERDLPPGLYACLTVHDDGPGMDEATRGRVFEPFFTTKPVNEGTGLGLSVVFGIVLAHDGEIVVESAPGRGSNFTIYLPIAETQAGISASGGNACVAAVEPKQEPGSDLHILYLDDDESLVLLVKRLLERRGFRVSGYTDQGEALDALRTNSTRFDLVLSDYNMPGMSGLDVAREVRAIRANLPVAIASGFIDDTLRSEAVGAGVRELIFKADAVDEFCAVVLRLAQSVGE